MTKSKSSFTFFAQEYCEEHNLTHQEIQHKIAILQCDVKPVRDTAQAHEQLREIFSQWRQVCESRHAHKSQPNPAVSQLLQELSQALVLDKQAESEFDRAVLELIKAYFLSDRSSYELLKLSNRLFKLGQAYNKSGK